MTNTEKSTSRKGRADDKDLALGNKLRHLRKSQKQTLHDLAKLFGISAQQVQKYETGEDRLSAVRLLELCKTFNYSLTQFTDGYAEQDSAGFGFAEDHAVYQTPAASLTAEEKTLLDYFRCIDDAKARDNVLQLIKNLIDAKR